MPGKERVPARVAMQLYYVMSQRLDVDLKKSQIARTALSKKPLMSRIRILWPVSHGEASRLAKSR
jgi:hypothetical protein